MRKVIYSDDTLIITQEGECFYLETLKKGKSFDGFLQLIKQFPYINPSNLFAVKRALNNAPCEPQLFAVHKEKVTVEISRDSLEAYITLYFSPDESDERQRKNIISDINNALKKANVSYGIIHEVLNDDLPVNKPILIAKGKPPVHGKDSKIKMYKIPEPKPRVIDDGSVNYYDLDLIHHVKAGDWLGEKTHPIPGIPGIDVHGNPIEPVEGISYPILFEHSSVELVTEKEKDVLYSLKSGAVHYVGDSIAVYDAMEIDGNVDFNTGNIDFNGYVNIKGTVEENFSVKAVKDIEISGEYGVGGVNSIESTEGNIYIRGGIAGKNKAKIICKKNLYVKYLSDTEVICDGTVFIGFYARNSRIRAKQVIVESPRGQIVGGFVDADIRIESADIGNRVENRTIINIRGFSRITMQNRIDEIITLVKNRKEQLTKLKRILKSVDMNMLKEPTSTMQKTRQAIYFLQEVIRNLESERLSIINYLRTPGEGAVVVRRRIYPKVKVVIQNVPYEVADETMAPTYILKDGKVQSI